MQLSDHDIEDVFFFMNKTYTPYPCIPLIFIIFINKFSRALSTLPILLEKLSSIIIFNFRLIDGIVTLLEAVAPCYFNCVFNCAGWAYHGALISINKRIALNVNNLKFILFFQLS